VAVTPTSVLGKYRIIREIARSNDIVYEGVDPAMGRRVAIKELALPQHLAGSQKRERIERFYREAKAAGTLTHPNIVTIYDVGEENERHYIVMEYLEGHSLREIQQMQGALPLKESMEIALQLCDALGYAHSRGVVHRDVKPDNVHILPGGIIKLTDFGIARITAEPSITAHGQVFGTPSYMSPEQVASHTVDHRTDIFSLGITLYEMLTGRKPFQGDSVITITYNIMNIQPPMPVGVPPGLHAILQKALAKDVNMRYQNTAQMAADLRAEKYALESGNRTAQMDRIPQPMPSATLNTGSVPPEISGIPAFGPQQPGYAPPTYGAPPQAPYQPQPGQQPYPQQPTGYSQQPTNYPPPQYQTGQFPPQQQQSGMSPDMRRRIGLIATILGIALLLGLLFWAVSTAVQKVSLRSQKAYALKLYQDGRDAFDKQDYTAAETSYQAARNVLPDSPEAALATKGLAAVYVARGLEAQQHNDPPTALTNYNEALRYDRTNAAAWDYLGNVKSDQGDPTTAIQAWQNAIQYDRSGTYGADARHNSALAFNNLAQRALTNNDISTTRQYWQKAAQIDPGSDAANRALANLSAPTPPSATPVTPAQ
jgi:serine/threonine-protein kinase